MSAKNKLPPPQGDASRTTRNRSTMYDASRGVRRIPQGSFLYERIIPFVMIVFGILLVVIILVSLGLVLGVVGTR
ncbi:MAG TPA: hypothetical protein VFD70_22855 [Anaerolineae bacterium]|nr:hypothetical protein [Anaerolineae bacterium]